MTTLADKIAALPEWAPSERVWMPENLVATLARLELAREWIADAHHGDCDIQWDDGTCDCGRDALLKALEVNP